MHLTRRFFLKSTGAAAAYMGVAPAAALAGALPIPRAVTRGKTLVVVFLRGGADGLNIVVPFGDPHYATLRPSVGLAAPGAGTEYDAIDLDGTFALHPGLAPLSDLFASNQAVAAHAVGYANNTRSHFEEQDVWETGVIGNTVNSDGWLNRHLVTSTGHGPVRAVAVGESLPRIMHGDAPAFAIRGIDDLKLPVPDGVDPRLVASALEHAYGHTPSGTGGDARDLLRDTVGVTLDGIRQIENVARPTDVESPFPQGELGRQLEQVSHLIKADVGLEVAQVDFGGWDTHASQGAGGAGQFGQLVSQVGAALAAFYQDLGDRAQDVLTVTITDFGRTAAENGSGGTDHGWANCMLLMGGGVSAARAADGGRKVVTNWPGLAPDQLHEGRDLLHTTDFRDVLSELVRVHLGNPNLERVLPGHTCKPVGLIA